MFNVCIKCLHLTYFATVLSLFAVFLCVLLNSIGHSTTVYFFFDNIKTVKDLPYSLSPIVSLNAFFSSFWFASFIFPFMWGK